MLFCELDGARGHPAWAAGGGAALRDWRPGGREHAVWGAGDGRLLGGMQFGALALRDWRPGARGAGGCCFASFTAGC